MSLGEVLGGRSRGVLGRDSTSSTWAISPLGKPAWPGSAEGKALKVGHLTLGVDGSCEQRPGGVGGAVSHHLCRAPPTPGACDWATSVSEAPPPLISYCSRAVICFLTELKPSPFHPPTLKFGSERSPASPSLGSGQTNRPLCFEGLYC